MNVANRPFAVGVVDEEVERGVGAHEDVGEADYDVARGGDRRGDICCFARVRGYVDANVR